MEIQNELFYGLGFRKSNWIFVLRSLDCRKRKKSKRGGAEKLIKR